ncbi:helix-hairpin-helix domain-containing protein [Natronococcus wangiae]|uniref:helix-hairpin-helix domain-containing protein n=1 Tax=Natronococcus wangiae TaxID=3068275 RepID=UPI00273E7BD7|nr:helix-hairpin-helix domain-containing protein [Natronococcus sp. AD5]
MAILQKLKSLLGFDDSGSERGEREVGVTVERERTGTAEAEESAAADTDAAASTDSMTEPSDAPDEPAEPAEATGPDQTDAAPEEEKVPGGADVEEVTEETDEEPAEPTETETETETDAEADVDADAEPAAETDEQSDPVDVIKGIGPAYADRLADAGVETVADLADADAAELESETDISEKRIQGWIDRAQVR